MGALTRHASHGVRDLEDKRRCRCGTVHRCGKDFDGVVSHGNRLVPLCLVGLGLVLALGLAVVAVGFLFFRIVVLPDVEGEASVSGLSRIVQPVELAFASADFVDVVFTVRPGDGDARELDLRSDQAVVDFHDTGAVEVFVRVLVVEDGSDELVSDSVQEVRVVTGLLAVNRARLHC